MVIAFPWSGRDWNRTVAISGRAAMPGLIGGSGFNWRSVAGTTGMMRPRGGFRGLGQDSTDASGGLPWADAPAPSDNTTLDLSTYPNLVGNPPAIYNTTTNTSTAQGSSAASNQAPWWGSLLTAAMGVGKQITNYELNPLINKSTYIQTPQGGIIASNSPALAVNAAGVSAVTGGLSPLSTANLSSMMPLLLIGGGLVVVMMMAKR